MNTARSVVNVRKASLVLRGYKDLEDWRSKDGNLYIGRSVIYVKGAENSKWRNPFTVRKFGLERALSMYEDHIRQTLWNDLGELSHYKELGCWCKPDRCHGDVLLKLIEEYTEKK